MPNLRHAPVTFATGVLALLIGAMVNASAVQSYVLDVAWLLLAVASFIYGLLSRSHRGARRRDLLRLAVLLVVVFPIVSADDDLALFNVPVATQSALSDCEKQKQVGTFAHASQVANLAWSPVALRGALYLEPESPPAYAVSSMRHATGNHSPPFC